MHVCYPGTDPNKASSYALGSNIHYGEWIGIQGYCGCRMCDSVDQHSSQLQQNVKYFSCYIMSTTFTFTELEICVAN